VHLAHLRHPLAGDRAYGADPRLAGALGLTRPFLHAWRLAFQHPADGRPVEVSEPVPDDLEDVLERLRAGR
jgi:23S rRNA pseudouridine1911/1915/1917 synthase